MECLQVVGSQDNMGSGVQCQQESCPAGKCYSPYAVNFIFTFALCIMQQIPGYRQRFTCQGLSTMTVTAGGSIHRPGAGGGISGIVSVVCSAGLYLEGALGGNWWY